LFTGSFYKMRREKTARGYDDAETLLFHFLSSHGF